MIQCLPLNRDLMLNYLLFTIWIGLNVVDATSTYMVLQGSGVELNPIVSVAIKQLGLVPVLAVKVLLAGLIGIFILRRNPRLIFPLNILMTCVVAITTTSAVLS